LTQSAGWEAMLPPMKHLPSLLVGGLLAWSAAAFTLHAQAPAAADPFVKNPAENAAAKANAPWQNCFVVLEVYALDKNDARGVLENERGSSARYRRTAELAKAGKARLVTLTALTTKSGQRAVTEAIDEVLYATEFNSPVDEKSIALPSAYETRNVGDTFELEPVIAPDARTVDLNLVPNRVTLLGFRDAPGGPGDAPTSQPIFDSQKITTSVAVISGEPFYLGTLTPATPEAAPDQAGEIWLSFLHIDVQGPKPADAKPAAKTGGLSLVNLEYSVYSLDRAAARELLAIPASLTGAWEKLQPLLAEKKARFEQMTTIKTKSGQHAVVEEIREVRYATEFAGPSRDGVVENTHRKTVTETATPGPRKEAGPTATANETTTVSRQDPNAPRIPGYATAFETRNSGTSVEVEPVMATDGQVIDLNHNVQIVTHRGDLKTTGIAEKYPPMPLFETRKITTSLTVAAGAHQLVGTLNPPGADGVNERTDSGRTWLVFVHATPHAP